MKRDVLSVLMIGIGLLLSETIPGLVLGAPMAVFGAYWLVEPRVGDQSTVFRHLRRIGRLG